MSYYLGRRLLQPVPNGPAAVVRILVVVPTYNERENVGPLIRELLAQSEPLDVWVADDGSPDGTADVVREAMADVAGPGGASAAAARRGAAARP